MVDQRNPVQVGPAQSATAAAASVARPARCGRASSQSRRGTRRALTAMGVMLLVGASLPAGVDAQGADRIDLPDGWQPEGIATDGTSLFVGSLADGSIYRADPLTGEGSVLVPGTPGASALGVEYDPYGGRLWVAGGATDEVRAYDATSGALLGSWGVESDFLNDVAVTADGAFVTDSFLPQLVVIPFGPDGGLPGPDGAASLRLRGDIGYVSESFNANGIVSAPGWLVIVQTVNGRLFRVDPANGRTVRIDTGDVDLRAADGLELVGDRLFVVRNQVERVAVLDLGPWLASVALADELTDPELDVPTTAAWLDGALWVVNARFDSASGEDDAYWLTRLDVPSGS